MADLGCGHGASTILMAQAFPALARSSAATTTARRWRLRASGRAERRGRPGHDFEVASAQDFDGGPYDLVTTFDCLHDLGDPLGAARHIRARSAPAGTWMIVEPAAGDSVQSNLNPVGRVYYSFSAFLCVPNALSQEGGYALGAQAGEAAIRQVVTDAGFGSFRRVAETPFNLRLRGATLASRTARGIAARHGGRRGARRTAVRRAPTRARIG